MFHLDTNTLIYFFKGMGRVEAYLKEVPCSRIGVSTVVLFELEVGIAKASAPQKRRQQLASFTQQITVVPFGSAEATAGGQIRARLERAGTPIGPLDNLIAATALRHGASLVTRNVEEFRRVDGLHVVDWFE